MNENRNGLIKLLDEFNELNDDEMIKKGKLKHKIFERYGTDKKCFRCGSQLLISDLQQYEYLCFECDENMYDMEVEEWVN